MKTAGKLHQRVADLELEFPATASGTVTISIGTSTCDGSFRQSPASLLGAADRALYLAKKRGRNCSEFIAMDGGRL